MTRKRGIMNTDEINELEAGRELDALIAEKIFNRCVHVLTATPEPGIFKCRKCDAGGFYFVTDYEGRVVGVPRYSEDIRAALEIAEKLKAFSLSRHSDGSWHCWHWNKTHIGAVAETAPLAICRAALAHSEGERRGSI